MAGFAAVAAAGKSVERLLNQSFEEDEPVPGKKSRAVLVRSDDFAQKTASNVIGSPALSSFFYQVDFNRAMRAAWSAAGSADGRSHLPLDLYFLLTPWAENAEYELRILGKTMQCLDSNPILSGPLLHPSTEWAVNESVQLLIGEISTEAVMRTFDSLPTDYRLSVPYIARIVRLDSKNLVTDHPVTTTATGARPRVTS